MRPPHLMMLCIAGSLLLLATSARAAERPNVLILVGDDHNCEGVGAYGSRIARTPNIDRLAASGVRFDRAYCNAPMCTPSRQSFLTGRYPQCTGVRLLTDVLSDEQVTLAERLAEAGYRTGAFGKMHFNSDRSHGFQTLLTERDWDAQDRRRSRRALEPGVEVLPPWKPFEDPARVWLNARTLPLGRYAEAMHGTWYAEQAIAFMAEQSDRPFFAQVGFHEPHSPYWFPVDFKPRYNPAEMLVPPLGPEDRPQIPRIFADLTDNEKRGIRASYFTSVAWLDVNVGRVLDALDRLGLSERTLVVYVGDNGYMLGEHGRFEKHCFFEQAVRVPLIVRPPGRQTVGAVAESLVELVDIVPTVLDLAHVPAPADPVDRNRALHGTSLLPLMKGRSHAPRGEVYSEYLHNEEAMVRTASYKLVYRSSRGVVEWYAPVEPPRGRQVRLYDLQTDPGERRDVAGDPKYNALREEGLLKLADHYVQFPPLGRQAPGTLSPEDQLDWALDVRKHQVGG